MYVRSARRYAYVCYYRLQYIPYLIEVTTLHIIIVLYISFSFLNSNRYKMKIDEDETRTIAIARMIARLW